MLITGISESCAGVSGTKCAVHLDLARSNVVEFLLAPGRSCRCAPVERAAPPRAQPIKLCAPVRFRSAFGCHRTLHALEANKWQCAGNHGTWRLDRSDCGHRTFMSGLSHHERCRIQVRSAREARPVERGGGGDDGRARIDQEFAFCQNGTWRPVHSPIHNKSPQPYDPTRTRAHVTWSRMMSTRATPH